MVKNQPTGRIVRLVARALRERDRGNHHYNKAGEALTKARQLGFAVDQEVEVTRLDRDQKPCVETFTLVDNFTGDAAHRNVRIPHYDLKRVPKFKRTSSPPVIPSAVEEPVTSASAPARERAAS